MQMWRQLQMGSREYIFDDSHASQLDKSERYQHLKKGDTTIPEGEVERSSDENESDHDEMSKDKADDDDVTESLVDPEEEEIFR